MSVLSSSSAFCASSVLQKESKIFNDLYRGSLRSPSRDLDILDWTHLGDGRDLVAVCFDAAFGNDVS
jgi:hypothetical protein